MILQRRTFLNKRVTKSNGNQSIQTKIDEIKIMIEKTLKTTTGRLRVKIPTTLNEVTLGQIMEMQENANLNDLEAISILSAIPVEELQNIRSMDDFQVFSDYVLSLSNQIKYLYNSNTIPKKVTFISAKRSVMVNVPSNLAVEPAGAFMAAREIIADEIAQHIKQHGENDWKERFNPSLKACCQVLAHYFFCRVTSKKYNEYEAEEFCSNVKKLGVTEALPIAKHFFMSYPGLLKPKINYFHQLQLYWKKRQAYKLLRNLNI
jgi:hypothetical protein